MRINASALLAVAVFGMAGANGSVFEIRRVEPRGSGKGATFKLESARRVETVRLSKEVLLDRSALSGVRLITEQVAVTSGRNPEHKSVPAIEIAFTNAGRKRFAELTRSMAGKQLGVVMDGKLVAAPVIHEPIGGNTVTLTSEFTKEAAAALVAKVNAGK